jgi:hypothetical protein
MNAVARQAKGIDDFRDLLVMPRVGFDLCFKVRHVTVRDLEFGKV